MSTQGRKSIERYLNEPYNGLPESCAFEFLKTTCRWVAWHPTERGDRITKPPINPHTGALASVSDPTTWGSYDEAANYAIAHKKAGVGIILTGKENIIGIDLDNCVDDDGVVAPWAAEILGFGETYAEYSPSGSGIRMLALGSIDKAIISGSLGIEIYNKDRYLTITGRVITNV